MAKNTILHAVTNSVKGVNVLLYGPPGTGKTELSKTIAKELALSLVSIGEATKEGREPSRKDRLAELRLAQTMFERSKNNLILVDEMDDILQFNSFFGDNSSDKSLLYVSTSF